MDLFRRKKEVSSPLTRKQLYNKNLDSKRAKNKKESQYKLNQRPTNVTICDGIESKQFPIDSSLKIQFIFGNELLNNKVSVIISLKGIDKKNYILLSSDFNRMYLMILFICRYKIKPGFVRYSVTNNLNPFTESKTSDKYYYIIFKSDELFSLKDAVLQKQINLYDFKKGIIQLLKLYSLLNKKYNFIYNNINSECLYVNCIGTNKNIIMFDYTYAYDSKTQRNSKKKKYGKDFYEMKKLYNLNEISEKIEGNYDLICIIFVINICNSYLNEIPKELILNKDDIKFFNSNAKLYEKLNSLLKKDFLKTL